MGVFLYIMWENIKFSWFSIFSNIMAKDKKAKDQKVKSIKKQQKRRSKIAIK